MSGVAWQYQSAGGMIEIPPFPRFSPASTNYLSSIRELGPSNLHSSLSRQAGKRAVALAADHFHPLEYEVPAGLHSEEPAEDQTDIYDTYIYGVYKLAARAREAKGISTFDALPSDMLADVCSDIAFDATVLVCIAKSLKLNYKVPILNIAERSGAEAIERIQQRPKQRLGLHKPRVGSRLILIEDL